MSDDIVLRLRHWSREDDLDIGAEAAAEIERLRQALYEALRWHQTMTQPCPECGGVEGCHVGCEAHANYVKCCEAALSPPPQDVTREQTTEKT
jgi:hypothetical protein